MPAKRRAFTTFAHFFEAARRDSQIEGGLCGIEKRAALASCAGARVVQTFLLVFTVVFVTHRLTALDCDDLYVRKLGARPRAKMAIREIRHARDRALSGRANKSRIAVSYWSACELRLSTQPQKLLPITARSGKKRRRPHSQPGTFRHRKRKRAATPPASIMAMLPASSVRSAWPHRQCAMCLCRKV